MNVFIPSCVPFIRFRTFNMGKITCIYTILTTEENGISTPVMHDNCKYI